MQIDERDIEYEYSTNPRPDIDFGPATIQFVRTYIASNTSDSWIIDTVIAESKHRCFSTGEKKPRKINDCRPA